MYTISINLTYTKTNSDKMKPTFKVNAILIEIDALRYYIYIKQSDCSAVNIIIKIALVYFNGLCSGIEHSSLSTKKVLMIDN